MLGTKDRVGWSHFGGFREFYFEIMLVDWSAQNIMYAIYLRELKHEFFVAIWWKAVFALPVTCTKRRCDLSGLASTGPDGVPTRRPWPPTVYSTAARLL
jgi:hypothetical protein